MHSSKPAPPMGQTPIYKMHPYFARRSYRVFHKLLKQYSKEGDILFDPFGGGGVTLIEALSEGRRAIVSDINPIAAFLQRTQMTPVQGHRFAELAQLLSNPIEEVFRQYFTTACNHCTTSAKVRWLEHAYTVQCPHCNSVTLLNHDSRPLNVNQQIVSGCHVCNSCERTFRSANHPRQGSQILTLRYICQYCGAHENKEPDLFDIGKFRHFEQEMDSLLEEHGIQLPTAMIPTEWDRQHEDGLHRKGFFHFTDFFTKRNLVLCGLFFTQLESMRSEINDAERQLLLLLLSSLLHHTNNMNFATSSEEDGHPVAWSKHSYITPNQFIELNPFECYRQRVDAFLLGIKDRHTRFSQALHSSQVHDVIAGHAHYTVECQDSAKLDLPDESIDLILTDPPYGSHVQYGELCQFWYVWLKGKIPFQLEDTSLSSEAVVHRKTQTVGYAKDTQHYYNRLHAVFVNSYRALKPEGSLVFPFHNQHIQIWYLVMKAVLEAGFAIEPGGVVYQENDETKGAVIRFDGIPQGEFIYTFRKTQPEVENESREVTLNECLHKTLLSLLMKQKAFNLSEYLLELFATSMLFWIQQMNGGVDEAELKEMFAPKEIEAYLNSWPLLKRQGKQWIASVNS